MKDEEQKKEIKIIMDEILGAKGLNLEKLSDLTDIPKGFLFSLYNGDFKKLPPMPYVKGYIDKIAEVLETDGERIWQAYKDNLRRSGEEDKLPINRFAFKKAKKGKVILFLIGIGILIILGFQGGKFIGVPQLEIYNPPIDSYLTDIPTINLRGKINPQDKLMINMEDISVDGDGYFEKNFSLEPGTNTIEFKVKKLLGKEVTIIRQVIYQI